MNELITSEQRDEAFKSIKSYPENKVFIYPSLVLLGLRKKESQLVFHIFWNSSMHGLRRKTSTVWGHVLIC